MALHWLQLRIIDLGIQASLWTHQPTVRNFDNYLVQYWPKRRRTKYVDPRLHFKISQHIDLIPDKDNKQLQNFK